MTLLTDELVKQLPPLYSQEGKGDEAIAYAKFYHPVIEWTWYILEYSPEEGIFFGLVFGYECELGYVSLWELEENNVVRDDTFTPRILSQVKAEHQEPPDDLVVIFF